MDIKEATEKYGDCEVRFSHYYKYVFSFIGETKDSEKIHCTFGGDPGGIYRFSVTADESVKVGDIAGEWMSFRVVSADGTVVINWTDW